MKRLVFEGTEEELKNLKLLIEQGDNNLPMIRDDYQTENLWCVDDVKHEFECTKEEALELLHSALTNDATMEQIKFAITFHAEEMGLIKTEID